MSIPTHVYEYHKLLREREDTLTELAQAVRDDNVTWAMMALVKAMMTNSFIEYTYTLAMARKDLLAKKYAKLPDELASPGCRGEEMLA